jgi:hypothetical protein
MSNIAEQNHQRSNESFDPCSASKPSIQTAALCVALNLNSAVKLIKISTSLINQAMSKMRRSWNGHQIGETHGIE